MVASLAGSPDRPSLLDRWWKQLPERDGIRLVSTPIRFGGGAGGEQAYAEQFARDEALERNIAAGLQRVLSVADRSGPALEIGAGTGILTRPLIAATSYPQYFISDTSLEFLRRTRESVPTPSGRQVDFVTLSGDELDRWPEATLSLVVLRYTLHHVLDWQGFVATAARLLRPGGVLLCEEPCADGFVLQAGMANVLRHSPRLLSKAAKPVRRDLDFFVSTTLFYARSGLDKSAAEDKHLFATYQLLNVCRSCGLEPTLFPNEGLDGRLDPDQPVASPFRAEFRHNLAVNFGFDATTLEFCEEHLLPACEELAGLTPTGGGPVVKAVLRAIKPPVPAVARLSRGLERFSRRYAHRARAAAREH